MEQHLDPEQLEQVEIYPPFCLGKYVEIYSLNYIGKDILSTLLLEIYPPLCLGKSQKEGRRVAEG